MLWNLSYFISSINQWFQIYLDTYFLFNHTMFQAQAEKWVSHPQPLEKDLINCNICNKRLESKQFEDLWVCKHESCVDCLKYYILFKFKRRQAQIKCPHEGCEQIITIYDLQKNKYPHKKCLQLVYKYINPNHKQCPICNDKKGPDKFQSLCACAHDYCKDCLQEYTCYKIKSEFKEIKCPFDSCNQIINKQGQIYLSLPEYLKVRYERILQNLQFLSNKSYRLCPNCEKTQLNQLKGEENLFCVSCVKKYCKNCLNPAHKKTVRCDLAVMSIIKHQFHFMKCKNCNFFVQKNEGCIHITCTCGHQFCYLCGGQWRHDHVCPPKPVYLRPRTVQKRVIPPRQIISVAKNNIQFNLVKLPQINIKGSSPRKASHMIIQLKNDRKLKYKMRESMSQKQINPQAFFHLILPPI